MNPAAFQAAEPIKHATEFPPSAPNPVPAILNTSFSTELLTLLPYPTLLLTPAGQVREANQAMLALLGMPRQHLRGQSIFDVVEPSNHATCEQLLRAACIEAGSTQIGELAFMGSTGAPLLIRCSILLPSQISPPQLLVIGQPLQEWLALVQEVVDLNSELAVRNLQLADLNRQLHQSEQQRERVTSMLVHDIRSPLVATSAGLEIARRGLAPAPVASIVTEAISTGLRSLQAVIELTNDLLDMKKFADGHQPIEIEPIALAALCSEVQATLHALSIQQDAHIDIDVPRDVIVRGERRILRRVLLNVITNALRFTPPGQRICVSVEESDNRQVMLVIADRGPGVALEDRERIFLPFVQGAGESKRGSGLGLAFCREALQAHGGRIWVEERAGGGSRFCLILQQV
ncbi:MAG TPA: PAS domain-containing sensor histidine kinase [Roseiflexaceae bacterium]|nr:PAS domain-containing sensor histidine kinase [Roseiflexaceae bacterium]